MPDDITQTGKPDDSRINVGQPHEVDYWSDKLGVTPDQLKTSVKKVGPMVKDVKKDLGK